MYEIKILSDEEYAEYQKDKRRKSFLQELEKMTKPAGNNSFSVKNVKPDKKKEKPKIPSEPMVTYGGNGVQPMVNSSNKDDWGAFISDLSEVEDLSPINSVTDERISGFQLDEEIVEGPDKYSNVFKKELAMLSEVLKDVKTHGTRVNQQLNKMSQGSKGAGNRSVGISKNYSDLVEAYNSINSSKVQIIKTMADLRAKQVDWKMKDKAANPDESENTDNVADRFFKNIVNTGTKNFISSTGTQQYATADFEYDPITDSQAGDLETGNGVADITGDTSEIDSIAQGVGFNITQPLRGQHVYSDTPVLGDEFGNIATEKKNVDICVYEYGNNNYQFVALDEDGEVVEGVELPSDVDPSIYASLHVRPGSDYVYDKYNRKYRIIQMGGVDISDIDQMDYPFGSDDDKY
jgi:hypothetical protein